MVIFCGVFGWFGLLLSDNRIKVCVFRHVVIQVKVKIVSSLNNKNQNGSAQKRQKAKAKKARAREQRFESNPETRIKTETFLWLCSEKAKTNRPASENKRKNAPSTAAPPDNAMDPMLSVCPTHSPMHSYVARSHSRAVWSLTKTRHSVSQNSPKNRQKSRHKSPNLQVKIF
eukprot:COSAG04_NODE_1898_length_5276_cov_3.166506_2_plen_172_part_00